MRKIIFSSDALESLQKYKAGNQNLIFKVLEFLSDVQQFPFAGKGKPEPLKNNLQGSWSRRINDEHRFVYRITPESIEVISCYGHYRG